MNFVNMFLNFDKLIGTSLVKFIYFVGLIGIALGCLFIMFAGFSQGFLAGLGTIVIGPILAVVYVLFWRFACELWIVMFKISNDLSDVKKSLAGGAPVAAAPTPPPA